MHLILTVVLKALSKKCHQNTHCRLTISLPELDRALSGPYGASLKKAVEACLIFSRKLVGQFVNPTSRKKIRKVLQIDIRVSLLDDDFLFRI